MDRIEKEKRIVCFMIETYCGKRHRVAGTCAECRELASYSSGRLDKCRYRNEKPFCSKCATQCYGKKQRESIREIMRYIAPRMLFYHPLLFIKHILL
jgi:hypothetical protein